MNRIRQLFLVSLFLLLPVLNLLAVGGTAAQVRIEEPQPGPDYVLTPNGWLHRSCTIQVPDGAKVDNDGDELIITRDSQVVSRLPKCNFPSQVKLPKREIDRATRRSSPAAGAPVPAVNGWVEFSDQTAPPNGPGQWYVHATGQWTVPTNPSASNGQTLFFFNSFMDSGGNAIIQPVLQWGPSSAGGGSFWAIGSWYVTTSSAAFSTLKTVSAGDVVTGVMEGYTCSSGNCTWNIWTSTSSQVALLTTGAGSWVYDWAQPAVFEAYSLNSCTETANDSGIPFYNTFLYEPNPPNLREVATATAWGSNVFGGTPNCGWGVGNGTRATSLTY